MEDHLKNKNRLQEEWEALCAYQAEPSSSLVAQREENVAKNRCPEVLTCRYQPWVPRRVAGRAAAPVAIPLGGRSPAPGGPLQTTPHSEHPQPGLVTESASCGPVPS